MHSESPPGNGAVRTGRMASLVYNALVKSVRLQNSKHTAWLWHRLWLETTARFTSPVRTTIHGHTVAMDFGNPYPVNIRRFHHLNNPLVELVQKAHTVTKRPITFVDIGAATGDTILLLHERCRNMIDEFYCIDGDPEFFRYLQQNLRHFREGTLLFATLSSDTGTAPELVRIHGGTASAQGTAMVDATTLDAVLLARNLDRLDVLKSDVDGYDGRVLRGAPGVLTKYRPAVIFEWHPILCERTSNSWHDPFESLEACGYTTFIWYTKFGDFSHFVCRYDRAAVERLARLCLRDIADDRHYDVIALHSTSPLSPEELAELRFARSRTPPPLGA